MEIRNLCFFLVLFLVSSAHCMAFIHVIFYVLNLCCQCADGLIGLRPARKTPPKDKTEEKQTNPVSPLPSQLISPSRSPLLIHNQSNHDDSPRKDQHNAPCHPIPLLRCSFRLIRQSLQNDSTICRQVQDFSVCTKSNLRENGRRDFVIGIDILDEFTRTIYTEHECHGNRSSPLLDHTRHQRSKRVGSHCCVDGIIDCAVRTFLKMTYTPGERCAVVDFYELCLHEISTNTCQLQSLRNFYPVFTEQLKRKCGKSHTRRGRHVRKI